ncbi:MAG TPA: MFS transporter [Anaerolineaceae bacterium]
MTGPLEEKARYNLRIDLLSAPGAGIFLTSLSFLPVILRRLGASPVELAVYNLLFYIGVALTGLSLMFMRRQELLKFASLCWIIGRGSFLAAFLISNVAGFLVLIGFYSLVNSMAGPAYSRIVAVSYPSESRGKAMAFVRLGMTLTMLIFTPILGAALDHFGYRLVFPFLAVAGISSVLIFRQLRIPPLKADEPAHKPSGSTYNPLAYPRNFLIHLTAIVLFGLGGLVPYSIIPMIQVDQLHLTYTQLGWLNLAMNLFWLIGLLFTGKMLDKYGAVRLVQFSIGMGALSLVPYLFATNSWMLLPGFIASGLCNASADLGFFNAVLQLNPPRRMMQASTFQSTIIGIRGLAGPFIGVGLISAGLPYISIIGIGVALNLIGALILFLINAPKQYPAE